jgi:hypothetical protein
LKVAIPTKYLSSTENYPHSEMDINDLIKSKTDLCNQYDFVDHHTSNRYIFVDTPSVNDTRGFEQDKVNMKNIVDAVEKLGSLSAIIIIINGSVSIFSCNPHNILTHLHKHFQLDNVINIVMLTNTYQWSSNFNLGCLNSTMSKIYPFYVQMSAFSTHPKKLDESDQKQLQFDWKESMAQIHETIELIDSLAPHF